jgi:DNA-binding HxlR family transcriptional regulator
MIQELLVLLQILFATLLLDALQGPANISVSDFGKVMNQMVALGLIEGKPHPTNPASTLWVATPYGTQAGARLLAVKR